LLRITVDEQVDAKWLKLEGRVTGPWANEFERTWREIAAALDSRKLGVDLRGVTHMDAHGRKILAEIHRRTGAEFLADSPMTKFFAEEARRSAAESGKQEE
jgi:anti-anti-sigma regulatory factor